MIPAVSYMKLKFLPITLRCVKQICTTFIIQMYIAQTFTIIELKAHFEKSTGRTLSGLELQFKGNPMLELQASKKVTLGDCGIDKEETIFLVEKGFTQTISNPEV